MIDSHDSPVAKEVKRYIDETNFFKVKTLTVEYDHNIRYDLWNNDIQYLKEALKKE